MIFTYNIKNPSEIDINLIKAIDGVTNAELNSSVLKVDADQNAYKKVEDAISSTEHYTRYTLKASIDCAECAREVEEGLNKLDGVAYCSFSYSKGVITIITKDDIQTIKSEAEKIEDEIKFLDDDEKKYIFSVKIDCAECAKKVENALNTNANVKSASFNFPKGKLSVETTLSEDEIKELCKEVEDDIEFVNEEKSYVFSVTIDCAECASKVENALNNDKDVKKAHFDFPKGKLYVTTTLTEEEVRERCLKVEDDMEFHTSQLAEKKDYSLYRIIVAAVFFIIAKVSGYEAIAIISYVIAGYDVLIKAFKNILKGKVFDENFLMSIATIAALAISSFDEAAAVMIFYQVGEYFQRKAVGSSRDNIGKLMDLSTDKVSVKRNNEWVVVKPEEVKIGDIILLKSGEKLAVDGTVVEGESFLDTRALTGESVPVKVSVGSSVLSGSVNGENSLVVRAEKEYSDSTASKIMKLVEESEGKKATSEKFITRFSRYYTPSVCAAALIIAIVPSLFGLTTWKSSIYRAAMLLVISCPCALVLSVPLTYFASMGSFAKRGILVKGDDAIQKLNKTEVVAMDKTGTLTEGVFSVQSVEYLNTDMDHLLDVAYALEKESTHPISTALLSYSGERNVDAESVHTITGVGIEGILNGKVVKAGSKRIMNNAPEVDKDGTLVYVTEDDKLLGVFVISDKIRESSYSTIRALRENGVKKIYMLSGDRKERAEKTALSLGMDKAYGELLPNQKLELLEQMKKEGTLLYVGDGINDAPALKSADVGVAMGGVGSDTAIAAADCVIMNDDLSRLPVAIKIAKKTEKISRENIYFSLFVKAVVFILAILGIANMWIAVFADTGVSLIAVINAMRAMHFKENK